MVMRFRKAMQAHFDKCFKYYFVFPALGILVLLLGYPIITSLYYSMTNKSLIKPSYHFIGFGNYAALLRDDTFWLSFRNSVFFTIVIVGLQLLLGMVAAICLDRITKGKGLIRTLMIIPWAFPTIVMSFTWSWLFNDLYGPINGLLTALGLITKPILFLSDPQLAALSVIIIMVWFGFPFMMVNILAGLQSISKSEYEAAEIDGAGALQKFKHITVPHLSTVLGLLIVLRIVWVFNNFDLIFLMTGGGPGTSTQTLPLYAYRMGWGLNSLGKASAVAVLLLVFLLICSNFYFKVMNLKGDVD